MTLAYLTIDLEWGLSMIDNMLRAGRVIWTGHKFLIL